MKIVTLNTWGGRAGSKKILSFFEKYKNDVDVFCLQEVLRSPYESLGDVDAGGLKIKNDDLMVYGFKDISNTLSDFNCFFHPNYLGNYGLAMFVRKDLDVKNSGDIFVHLQKGQMPEGDIGLHPRNIQYVTLSYNNRDLNILNFHGLWNGKGKNDSEDRKSQSRKSVKFISNLKDDVVFCGDFNLKPETDSIKIIENFGMRNLISEYGILSTRTSYYKKSEKFADYMFVTKEIVVNDFKVLPEEVSDHAALQLDIK